MLNEKPKRTANNRIRILFKVGTSSENEVTNSSSRSIRLPGYSSGAELSKEEMLLSRNPIKVNKIFRHIEWRKPDVKEGQRVREAASLTVGLLTYCGAREAELS